MKDSDPDLHLIRLLADGRFHSGGDLGEALGVSRAAIWKRLQRAAEAYGLSVVEQVSIESTPNPHNLRYLETKRDKMGHVTLLPSSELEKGNG